jgi:hypothetical protein
MKEIKSNLDTLIRHLEMAERALSESDNVAARTLVINCRATAGQIKRLFENPEEHTQQAAQRAFFERAERKAQEGSTEDPEAA